jgi:hypothetical protein
MRLFRLLVPATFLLATGCHSPYIDATISNRTDKSMSPVEMDYPSASLGTETLGAGKDFHYRFKVQGSGATKLIYTDSAHAEHTVAGPFLNEGDEGSLAVTVKPNGIEWSTKIAPHQ